MAVEYTDENVPIRCGECDKAVDGIRGMVEHVIAAHPGYSPSDAADFARDWADSAYEDIDLENMRLNEEYRRDKPRGI
jgi:hypothetical protein